MTMVYYHIHSPTVTYHLLHFSQVGGIRVLCMVPVSVFPLTAAVELRAADLRTARVPDRQCAVTG